jgi:RimJ/RimL family protein N-acetyltransferase
MLTLPITTARLVIRMMRDADAPALLAYRNDPAVAEFQDWELPYTEAMAADLIAAQAGDDGPADGRFVQLAVESDGVVVGDLAVGLFDSARQATIGYSIMSQHQRRGYATEAVGAVVDGLFAAGLHRIVATADPANAASRGLLQKLGFRHEGRSIESAFVRGAWMDDDRFALLQSEHSAAGEHEVRR